MSHEGTVEREALDQQIAVRLSAPQREYLRRQAAQLSEKVAPLQAGEADVVRMLIDEARGTRS